MSDYNENIVSIHLETPTKFDRWFRKATEAIYVVEHIRRYPAEYGGYDQKRHQRRYRNFIDASLRLDYILANYHIDKAFILNLPIDVVHYTKKAIIAAACPNCGRHQVRRDV